MNTQLVVPEPVRCRAVPPGRRAVGGAPAPAIDQPLRADVRQRVAVVKGAFSLGLELWTDLRPLRFIGAEQSFASELSM